MQRVFDFLRTHDLPVLSRSNYVVELRHMSLWGIVIGAVEGNMASVVASKTFDAPRLLTTIIWALPILVNVLNLGWSAVLRGRPRKPTFLFVASCGLAAVASVGLTSAAWKPWGAWLFAAQIGLTHLFLSGLITLRTTMWKVNYPQTHRARIAGRLQTLRMLLSVLTAGALSLLYDHEPLAYRLVYPLVALIGACSLIPLRRLRMRGERAELRRFRMHLAQQNQDPDLPNGRLWTGLREAALILRQDTLFARYMLAQFLLGSANFFTDPILVNVLTKELGFDYFASQSVMYLLPITVLLISIRFWARYFDQVGVLRFRVYNSAAWVISYLCITLAMAVVGWGDPALLAPAVVVLFIGRLFTGLGRGGGAIAWNLGHLHFAGEHQTELYMGIHVALTGLRGLLMPLLGWLVNRWLGYGSFAVALAFALTAHILFRRLVAADARPPRERELAPSQPAGPRDGVT